MERLFFPPPSERNKFKVDLNLNLENYATKTDLKAITGVDTSSFIKKTDLDDVESDIKEIKKDFVNSKDFDSKVNTLIHKNLDSGDVDKRIKDVKKEVLGKIPNVSGFITKTEVDTKINSKLPDVSKFVTDAEVDNKISNKIKDVTKNTELDNYVKKAQYDTDKKSLENVVKDKVSSSELEITKGEIELVLSNKVDTSDLKTKLDLQKVLIGDADIQIKKLQTKIDAIKTGDVPTKVINEYKFIAGRKYFTGSDNFQNKFIYPPILSTVERDDNDKVKKWMSIGKDNTPLLSYKKFKPIVADFAIHFDGHYLAHKNQSDVNKDVANFYIVCDFDAWPPTFGNTYAFHNSLFGSVDSNFNGRGLAFDSRGEWTHADGSTARNIFIFGTDNSNSKFDDNRKLNFTCLGRGYTEFFKGKNVFAESVFKKNFTKNNIKFVLSLHYNSDKSYLIVNGEEIYNFKALKNLKAGTLALGILHKNYPDEEVKDVSLYGNVYEFSVDYRALEVEEIKNIHTYLMKKHGVNTT